MISVPNAIIVSTSVADVIKFAVVVRILRISSVIPAQKYKVIDSCGSLGRSKGYTLGYGSTPWRYLREG